MRVTCSNCGAVASGRFCGRCGAALVLSGDLGEAIAEGKALRSAALAYGLWALCLVGVAGVHRFYARKYVTGLIWLFTWGLFGLGSLIDLFLINGMVEEANRRILRGD